jgi:two-component system chemotaxis sensor kinase CheA
MSPEQLAPIRVQFFQECVDLLAELECGLIALERGDADPETVNTVFRAAHSIKGGAAIFGLADLVRFAHDMENVLDGLRSGRIPTGPEALAPLLRAADVLSDLVDAARDSRAPDLDRAAVAAAALAALTAPAEDAAALGADDEIEGIDFAPIAADLDFEAPSAAEVSWRVRFRPHAELYRKANDPLLLLGELARLGQLSVALDTAAVPRLEALNPEEAYLSWTIGLGGCDEPAIREVFEFVEGDCDLDIGPAAPDDAVADAPAAEVETQASDAPPALVATAARPAAAAGAATIRVDLERVDRLIDLVSELVISEATLAERVSEAARAGNISLSSALDDLRHLTRDLQESVMAIRAQPVKSLFQRMSRLVREVEAQTGKSITLTTEGDETEVDRAVVERLTDPLTHMIRNAVDHGIESPQGRRAANKPERGSVHICAAHRAGRVVIEVTDDGAGIDRERVRAIAIDRGLIATTDILSDDEIDNLIFEAGFSTTVETSDLSGRGVGMDVVRRSVQALGGRISLSSRRGQGSTFSLSLPLTLAVMDGMLVTVRGQCLVVPLTALVESVTPRASDIRRLGADVDVMAVRGAYVPLIDLADALDYRGGPARPTQDLAQGVALLVEDDAGERIALRVDDIVDQRQVVIKSLEANYHSLKGIAAATILGDGRVALIVDVNAIIGARKVRAADHERQAAHA